MCLQKSVLLGSVAAPTLPQVSELPVSGKPPVAVICAAPFASQDEPSQGNGILFG